MVTVPGAVNLQVTPASEGEASSKAAHAVPVDLESSSLESLDPQPSPPRSHALANLNGNAVNLDTDIDVNIDVNEVLDGGNERCAVENGETHPLTTNGESTNVAHASTPIPVNATPAAEEQRSMDGAAARVEMNTETVIEPSEEPATTSMAPPRLPIERRAKGIDNEIDVVRKARDDGNPAIHTPTADEYATPTNAWPSATANATTAIDEELPKDGSTARLTVYSAEAPAPSLPLPAVPIPPTKEESSDNAPIIREELPADEVTQAAHTMRKPLHSRPSTPQRFLEENTATTEVLTRITEDAPPSIPISVLPTAERVPIPAISENGPVDVYLSNSVPIPSSTAAYIWNASDALRLRHEYRLVGDWLGTLPKHTAQNQYLSVPLALSYDELYFGYTHGFLRVFNHSPDNYPVAKEEDVAEFYQGREDDVDRHAEELEEQQRKQKLKRASLASGNGSKRKRTAWDNCNANTDGEGTEGERRALTGKKRKRASTYPDARDETTVESRRKASRSNEGGRSFMGRVNGMVSSVFGRLFSGLVGRGRNGNEDATMAMEAEVDETTKQAESDVDDEAEREKSKMENEAQRRRTQARASTVVLTPCEARETVKRVEWEGELPGTGMPVQRVKQRAAVFKDLYTRGYAMSCGAKFGADLLAYAGDPHLFHAALSVVVLEGNEAEVSMHELVALGRLGDSTKKRTVLAYHDANSDGDDGGAVKYVGVQWEENLP